MKRGSSGSLHCWRQNRARAVSSLQASTPLFTVSTCQLTSQTLTRSTIITKRKGSSHKTALVTRDQARLFVRRQYTPLGFDATLLQLDAVPFTQRPQVSFLAEQRHALDRTNSDKRPSAFAASAFPIQTTVRFYDAD